MEEKIKRKSKIPGIIADISVIVFLFVSTTVLRTSLWFLGNWAGLSIDEVIFHAKTELSGTNPEVIRQYILECGIIEIAVPTAFIILIIFARKKQLKLWIFRLAALASGIVLIALTWYFINSQLKVTDYISNQNTSSDFIENNYADPADIQVTFPESKRNLIYIYLESMEMTYSDTANGGAYEDDYIPYLTKLAQENEDFSGASNLLNGGYSLMGTTWTSGAMFAQTSGLPLIISIDGNDMGTQGSFFPSLTNMGDILEANGYNNVLMIGSEKEFGGREGLFTTHGGYEIYDYNWALDTGMIPDGYHVFWGFEDKKLIEFAKEKLLNLSESEEPFNFTMLTVDTHFEDGYVCELCDDEYADQYANVISCSDRQISAFVEWIQQQDFYEDTTIVISGDHPTMDSDFCLDIDPEYQRRVYTSYINASPAEDYDKDTQRQYCTFDNFPTTLAALGCTIEGNRLGLGTNLFSKEETLVEKYGCAECNEQLSMKSDLLDSMLNIELTDELMERVASSTYLTGSYEDGKLTLSVNIVRGYAAYAQDLVAQIQVGDDVIKSPLNYSEESGTFLSEPIELEADRKIKVTITGIMYGADMTFYDKAINNPGIMKTDIIEYLDQFVGDDDVAIFIAIKTNWSGVVFDELAAEFDKMGLYMYTQKDEHSGYLAVIDAGNTSESVDLELARLSGVLDGTDIAYDFTCQGYDVGNEVSLTVNGKDIPSNRRDIDIAVYSKSEKKIIGIANYLCGFTTFGIRR